MINSYTEYFEFSENPFKRTPDVQFYFSSKSHQNALETLQYLMASDDEFAVLTGSSGYGKSILLRMFAAQLPATTNIAFINFPYMQPKELLFAVLEDLHISYDLTMSTNALYSKFRDYLIARHENGGQVLLVIEDAQDISDETFEALRILSNLETEKKKLLKIIIAGQPELINRLYKLRDLKQRIALIASLEALTSGETADYINHYLAVAGGKKLSISKSLAHVIWEQTKGNPRSVNVLMERVLVVAFMDKSLSIKRIHINSAVKSMNTITVEAPVESSSCSKLFAFAIILVLLAGASYVTYNWFILKNIQVAGNDNSTQTGVIIIEPDPVTANPVIEPIEIPEPVIDPVEPVVTDPVIVEDPVVVPDPVIEPVEPVVVSPVAPGVVTYGVGNGAMVRRTTSSLNVRSAPDLSSERIGTVAGGTVLRVKEETAYWIKFDYNSEKEGWVYKTYMEPTNLPPSPVPPAS